MSAPTREHSAGTGDELVLLHGLTCSWRSWEPVLPELERHHRVIAPTLPGHRGADALPAGVAPSVAALTDAVEARLDALELDRPAIAGNSIGGWIALELARRGRARSVVALSPAGAWDPMRGIAALLRGVTLGRSAAIRLRVAEWRLVRRPRGRRLLLGAAMARPERMPVSAAAGMLSDITTCSLFDALGPALLRDGPLAGPIAPKDCPITIAWGQRDRVIPFEPFGRLMLQAVPSARYVELPGVGHIPMWDDPALVATTILDGTRA